MSWDNIYRKWGLSEEAITGLNIITWLFCAALVVMGVLMVLAFGLEWIKQHRTTDDKEKTRYRKEKWNKLILAIPCFFAAFIWPIILWIMDAAGVGKITSGDFIPNAFNLIKEIGVINI